MQPQISLLLMMSFLQTTVTNVTMYAVECWNPEPHERPLFAEILEMLDEIGLSSFVQTPHESFHVMQEDWRHEIETMFEELRSREQVRCRSDDFLAMFVPDLHFWDSVKYTL